MVFPTHDKSRKMHGATIYDCLSLSLVMNAFSMLQKSRKLLSMTKEGVPEGRVVMGVISYV